MEAFAAAGAAEAVRTSDAGAVSDEHAATGPVVADMEGQDGGVSDTGTGGYGEHDKFHRGLRDGEGNEGARREEMQGRSIDASKGDDVENEEVAGKPLADGGHELGAAGLRAAAEAGRVEGCPERRYLVEIGALHGAGKAPGPAKDGKGNKRGRQQKEPGREVLAEVRKLPEIASNVEQAAELALRVITERREHGEGIEPIRVVEPADEVLDVLGTEVELFGLAAGQEGHVAGDGRLGGIDPDEPPVGKPAAERGPAADCGQSVIDSGAPASSRLFGGDAVGDLWRPMGFTSGQCLTSMKARPAGAQPNQEVSDVAKNNEHVVSVEEAADLLGIGRNSAYDAVREGRFPVRVIRVGARYLIPRVELEELLGISRAGE